MRDDVVKFDDATTSRIEVKVDNNKLPLKIGDNIDIGDGIIRIVMKIQVDEHHNVTYGLQWLDGCDFKINWFSWNELCYMSEIIKRKPTVSL